MNPTFFIADCPRCARQVLLAHDLQDDALITQCVHCGQRIDDATEVDAARLDSLGYTVEGMAKPKGERGCRGGQCGVRQIEPDDQIDPSKQ